EPNHEEGALVLVLMSRLFVRLEGPEFKVMNYRELRTFVKQRKLNANGTSDELAQRACTMGPNFLGKDVKQSKADSKSKKPKEKVAGVKRGNVMRKTLPAESGVIEDVDGHTNREKKTRKVTLSLPQITLRMKQPMQTLIRAHPWRMLSCWERMEPRMSWWRRTPKRIRIGRKKSHARKGRAVERKELTAQIDSGTDEDDV
ncbi:hypothetical protein B0H14DRAFT_3004236, partial [Mycena olivaceomarginata]